MRWTPLGAPASELRLAHSLPTGQAFGWAAQADGSWVGAIGTSAIRLREAADGSAEYRSSSKNARALLRDYFQLETELGPLYKAWSAKDERLRTIATCLEGVRVLRQDPVECLFSFICSSNNNIARITLMLNRLREAYGEPLDGCYAFPTLERLAEVTEKDLRDLGFGYRAPYVVASAKLALDRGGRDYLLSLRGTETPQTALRDFRGVGPKVADCVALFSLDATGAIPVDTHVWRLARRDFGVQDVSLTAGAYERVGDVFRATFGSHAGWAHSLLFTAELPVLSDRLPASLLSEMRDFKALEKQWNAKRKRTDDAQH